MIRKVFYPIISICFLLLTWFPAGAQSLTQTIRGWVTDKESQEPLVGAAVAIISLKPIRGNTTDDTSNEIVVRGNNEKREYALQAGVLGLDFVAEGRNNDEHTLQQYTDQAGSTSLWQAYGQWKYRLAENWTLPKRATMCWLMITCCVKTCA